MVFRRNAPSEQENLNPDTFYDAAQSSFGYLIPSTYSDSHTNENGALGVVFDSGSSAITREPLFARLGEEQKQAGIPSYAKLTVMAGGEYYDGVRDPVTGNKVPSTGLKSKFDGMDKDHQEQGVQQADEETGNTVKSEPSKQSAIVQEKNVSMLPVLAMDTVWKQLGVPHTKDMADLKMRSKQEVGNDYLYSRLAENAIVQHGVGHLAQYNEECGRLEQKFGKGRVVLSGRAAHGNGITQCVDGAVSTAARVLIEGYGINKVEEVVRRIRTPPS
jgi:hypothetical protein